MPLEQKIWTISNHRVSSIELGEAKNQASKTVLFLRGIAFTKQDWADKGVLQDVANAGHRAIAIDLPREGFAPPDDVDPGEFLKNIVDILTPNDKLVIVSPSYSGFYSLAMLNTFPAIQLAGFIPIAPKNIDAFAALSEQQAAQTPTLITWANEDTKIKTRDPILGTQALQTKIPGSKVKLYDSASHAFYFDTPQLTQEFTEDLLTFI